MATQKTAAKAAAKAANGEVRPSLQAFKALGKANKELALQKMVERYQLANANANYSEDARLNRSLKVLAGIKKNNGKFADKGIKSLATYETLHRIYKEDISHLTDEIFMQESEEAIATDLKKFYDRGYKEVPEAVAEQIRLYHENKSHKAADGVNNIRLILTEQGLLKGKDAANVAELSKKLSHLEAEKEAERMAKLERKEVAA